MGPQGIDKIQAVFGENFDITLARGRASRQRFVTLTLEHAKSVNDVMRSLVTAGLAYAPRLDDGSEAPMPDTDAEDPLLVWREASSGPDGIRVFCEDVHAGTSL